MNNQQPTLNQADIDLLLQSMKLVFPTKFEMDQKIDSAILASEKRLEKKYDKIINLLDAFAGNVKSHEQQLAMVEGHKDQLEDHEVRLKNLELNLCT